MHIEMLLTGFLQSLGIVAIIALLYDVILKQCASRGCRRAGIAVLFALGGFGSMIVPIEMAPGMIFDLRAVFLVLAASYGGWPAVLSTVLSTASFRIWEGGAGVYPGLVSIVLTAAIGCAIARFMTGRPKSTARLVALGLVSPLSLVSIFVLPWEIASSLFAQVALPTAVANLIAVVMVGEILERERGRVEVERRLCEEASTDSLTGLATRRVLDRDGPGLAAMAAATGRPYTVMIIDLDHFKQVNDVHGHAAGDEVLRKVGSIVASSVRDGDLVARYGGEEVAVVLPNQDADISSKVAERIRTAIAKAVIECNEVILNVTASVGAFTSAEGAERFADAFCYADQALYVAKSTGRNRVVTAPGELLPATPIRSALSGRQASPDDLARGDRPRRRRTG